MCFIVAFRKKFGFKYQVISLIGEGGGNLRRLVDDTYVRRIRTYRRAVLATCNVPATLSGPGGNYIAACDCFSRISTTICVSVCYLLGNRI